MLAVCMISALSFEEENNDDALLAVWVIRVECSRLLESERGLGGDKKREGEMSSDCSKRKMEVVAKNLEQKKTLTQCPRHDSSIDEFCHNFSLFSQKNRCKS